jgi:uncharacterized membrane protein
VARVRCLAISANDIYLAVWLDTGILYLINLSTGKISGNEEFKPPKFAVHGLSFSANGEELLISTVTESVVKELKTYWAQTYNYLTLNGSCSPRMSCILRKVCQTYLSSMFVPNSISHY